MSVGVRASWYDRYEGGVHYRRSRRCAAVTKRMDQCQNAGIYVRDDERDLYAVCAAHRRLLQA